MSRFTLDQSALRQEIATQQGLVARAMMRGAQAGRAHAVADLTANRLIGVSGVLRGSIEAQLVSGSPVTAAIGTNVEYARYVHEGTGPITPTTARVLAFTPKRSGRTVFAARTSGTRATGRFSPFLTNALQKLRASDFT